MEKLRIKTQIREVVVKDTVKEMPIEDKYFWYSRSVYAVEFKMDIYKSPSKINEMTLIRVQFENDIIQSKKLTFSEEFPIMIHNHYEVWEKDLLSEYIEESDYSTRTKEQFYTDFDQVIKNLQSLKSQPSTEH